MKPIRLTHIFTFFHTLGGVESVLQRHWKNDSASGIDSQIVALFEPESASSDRLIGLGLTWRDSIASARQKFRERAREIRRDVTVYHNAWGLPFFADLDSAERRIGLLHSDLPTLDQILQSQAGLLDGFLCVTEPLQCAVRQMRFPKDRIGLLPYPISRSPESAPRPLLQGRRIRFGFSGRIVREQKRVDRLPALCQHLDAAGVPYEFEILGDGPDRCWLAKQFTKKENVVVHGRKSGDEYLRILSLWDAIVFVSDYEGLPISLLEALGAGVLPIYPRIGSGGDSYAKGVKADFLYPASDLKRAAELLGQLRQTSPAEISDLRRRCQKLALPHEGEAYDKAFADFVRKTVETRRISAAAFRPRSFCWSDHVPFGILRRIYYRGFFQRAEVI